MRYALLYSNSNGEPQQLVVDDTDNAHLPFGAERVLGIHGEDFNDGGGVFIVELTGDASDDPTVMDAAGDEIGRNFVTLRS